MDDFITDLDEFEEFNGYEFADMILEPGEPSKRRSNKKDLESCKNNDSPPSN